MKKNILVTGGAGYIGSHVCKALKTSGYIPVCYDNLINGHTSLVKWGPLETGDVLNKERLEEVVKKYKPVGAIHLAAFAYVGESIINPLKYYKNNVSGAIILLEILQKNGIKKVVFSSSCASYGNPNRIPLDESHPQNPINPYGRSKLMIEQMLNDFYSAYSLCSVSLRYFNAAGADAELETGELHDPETHLIPLAIAAAYNKISYLNVNGNNYNTHDGTCIRDYIHVTDLANAHILALNFLEDNDCSEAFNLSIDKGYSISEVIKTVEKITHRKVPFKIVSPRQGDPSVLIGNSEKARNSLLWNPNYLRLKDIIETAVEWYKLNFI